MSGPPALLGTAREMDLATSAAITRAILRSAESNRRVCRSHLRPSVHATTRIIALIAHNLRVHDWVRASAVFRTAMPVPPHAWRGRCHRFRAAERALQCRSMRNLQQSLILSDSTELTLLGIHNPDSPKQFARDTACLAPRISYTTEDSRMARRAPCARLACCAASSHRRLTISRPFCA